MASRRLTGLFSFKSASPGGSDTASVTSEYTGSTESPGDFQRHSRRKSSISNSLRLTEAIDEDIDSIIRNLYEDPDILEHKCQLSLQGKDYTQDTIDDASVGVGKVKGSQRTLRLSLTPEGLQLNNNGDGLSSSKSPRQFSDLSEKYFDKNYDPILELLHEVSAWRASGDVAHVYQLFEAKIEKMDAVKDVVVEELFSTIEDNYENLMVCMRNIHAIDLEISKASIDMSISRRNIQAASSVIHSLNN